VASFSSGVEELSAIRKKHTPHRKTKKVKKKYNKKKRATKKLKLLPWHFDSSFTQRHGKWQKIGM